MTIDTTTGLPYTGDALVSASDDPFAGMIPGRTIGRTGISKLSPGKAPGEGATMVNPPVAQSIYTPPVLYTAVPPVATQSYYTPPPPPPTQGPIQYVPAEQTWIPGVPNFVTGVTALALGYALYKTFFEAPRSNPSDAWGSIERKLGSQFVLWATSGDESTRYAVVRPEHFSGLRWQRYSASGSLIDQSGGAFYDTGDPKDHPEGAVEWARQSAVKAHQKTKALARENPNRRGRPTLKEVEAAFGDSLRHEYGDKAGARAKEIHAALQHQAGRGNALHEINAIIRGHGVEQFSLSDDSDDPDAIYINTGDLYNMTVIWEPKQHAYVLTDMGTWRSQNEKS